MRASGDTVVFVRPLTNGLTCDTTHEATAVNDWYVFDALASCSPLTTGHAVAAARHAEVVHFFPNRIAISQVTGYTVKPPSVTCDFIAPQRFPIGFVRQT